MWAKNSKRLLGWAVLCWAELWDTRAEIRLGGKGLLTRDSEVGKEQETAAAQPHWAWGSSSDHADADDAKAHFAHTHGKGSLQQSRHCDTCESEMVQQNTTVEC